MKNTKVLELLNNGEIEELKALLKKEIYEDNLKGNGNAMKRYSAMKRYFKYKDKNRNLAFNLPCKNIEVNGKIYNSFIDGYSFVLTSESIGEIEAYDNSKNAYPNIDTMVDFNNDHVITLPMDEEKLRNMLGNDEWIIIDAPVGDEFTNIEKLNALLNEIDEDNLRILTKAFLLNEIMESGFDNFSIVDFDAETSQYNGGNGVIADEE